MKRLVPVLLLLLAGCTLGPDFLRPSAPPVQGYTPEPLATATASADVHGGETQRFASGLDVPGDWWRLFKSEPLDRLMQQALSANPDLKAAEAALRQAQENILAGKGALYPSVDGTLSGRRQRFSGVATGRSTPASIFNLYNASVSVSYGLDPFGGVRRQLESLQAQAENQRFQLEAAYLTLTSNVVTAAVTEASIRAQIAATEDIIKAEARQLNVLQQQFELGGAARSEVLAQQATLAETQATLPPLQRQLAQTRNQLTALAGRFPSQDDGTRFELSALQLPGRLPLSLPSKLVEQRPDIRSAQALMHSASAQIGVATAAQFPQITLSADLGSEALKAADLFLGRSIIWSLGGSLSQSIFDAGTLEHQKRAAIAAYDEAAARYRSTVLTAFQDVANSLRALQSDAEALRAQLAAEASAGASLEIAHKQYQAGAITYLTLLNAEQTYQNARINLVKAQAARYTDTVALFQSLGGGWWNRTDVAADAALAKSK